jgi:glycosyltransferase involved in cell wall biosynthesis
MVVIPNGFDLESFRPDAEARASLRKEVLIPNGYPVIGLVGRFHPVKDHRNFLQAARLIHREKSDVHYVLCGHSITWENEELVGLIEEAGIRDRVRLLGPRQDIPKVTAAFDIACLSSCVEGFPNVVSEAMSCAVPCVVTDVGEAAFIVGQTGRVVQPRNPDALAKALLELLELGPEDRSRLGNAARQRIKDHFDLAAIVEQYERVFEEIACRNEQNHYQKIACGIKERGS